MAPRIAVNGAEHGGIERQATVRKFNEKIEKGRLHRRDMRCGNPIGAFAPEPFSDGGWIPRERLMPRISEKSESNSHNSRRVLLSKALHLHDVQVNRALF